MRKILFLSAALLSGCTVSPIRVASQQPYLNAPTARNRAYVTGCISQTWQDDFGFRTRTTEAVDHTSVILSTGNVIGIDMIADVFDGHTELRERNTSWGWLDGDLRLAVQRCL